MRCNGGRNDNNVSIFHGRQLIIASPWAFFHLTSMQSQVKMISCLLLPAFIFHTWGWLKRGNVFIPAETFFHSSHLNVPPILSCNYYYHHHCPPSMYTKASSRAYIALRIFNDGARQANYPPVTSQLRQFIICHDLMCDWLISSYTAKWLTSGGGVVMGQSHSASPRRKERQRHEDDGDIRFAHYILVLQLRYRGSALCIWTLVHSHITSMLIHWARVHYVVHAIHWWDAVRCIQRGWELIDLWSISIASPSAVRLGNYNYAS